MYRLAALLLILSCACCVAAPQRGVNLLSNPGFEQAAGSLSAGWSKAGLGYSLSPTGGVDGGACLYCPSGDPSEYHGAMQEVVFDPPVQHPFAVSGWSKAEGAEGVDYCLYMDCWYADGTNLWGQQRHFDNGTHDWQRISYVFDVTKPVTKIQFFILFRRCAGKAWFDNVSLSLVPFEFSGERVRPSLYGGNSIDYNAALTFPAKWTASVLRDGQSVFSTQGSGRNIEMSWPGTDASSRLLPGGDWRVQVVAKDELLGEELKHELPVRTQSGPGRGYVAWTESSMNRVLINTLPPESPSLSTHITLAGNEYESFQVALRTAPNQDLKGCTVEVGDLRGPKGSVIPARNITWEQVGFVEIKNLFQHPKLPTEAAPGWWPDPLLPVSRFDVPASTTQSLWFTVYAPPGTPRGEYEGQVRIHVPNSSDLVADVKAKVYGFDLPTQSHLKTAFALMDGYLEKLYGPLTPKLRQAYGDYVLQHRLNPDDISRTDPPDLEDLSHYNPRGLNAFNVINMVEPRGKRIWVCYSPLEFYTPQFKASLTERLDRYVPEMKRRGLGDKAYVYTFDERPAEFNPIMKEYFGLIKERYGIPTLTTAKVPQDPQVMKDLNIDWNCPVSSVYHFDEAERCRAAGLQVWSYICCGPRYPYANWLTEEPLVEARVIWWQAYQQKMDGFLYWGLNVWSHKDNNYLIDPEKDGPRLKWGVTTGTGKGDWTDTLSGDGILLYPGKEGPYGSIRLDNIRDGLEDYEYLWLLQERTGSVDTAREACLPVTESLTAFTRDPAVVKGQRDAIARRLEALGAK